MKKLILTSLAIAIATSLFPYGIDETNFNDLLNYRLPKWSYWSGNIRLEGNNSYGDTETYRHDSHITANLNVKYYLEKENHILDVAFSNYSHFSMGASNSNSNSNSNDANNHHYGITIENKNYLSEKFHLYSALRMKGSYSHSYREEYNNTDKGFSNSINANPAIGIGFGKTRNVTPLIKAKRLQHKLQKQGVQVSNEHVRQAAVQFSKQYAYNSIFSFERKHFWQDMNTALNGILTGLSPYAMLEVNDILSEIIWGRYEGYEAQISFSPYITERNGTLQGDDYKYWFGRFEGNYHKNLSYKYETSFIIDASYGFTNDDKKTTSLAKEMLFADVAWNNRYQIVNRLHAHIRISYLTFLYEMRGSSQKGKLQQLSLSPGLNLFIEDKILVELSFDNYFLDSNKKNELVTLPFGRNINPEVNYKHNLRLNISYLFGKIY